MKPEIAELEERARDVRAETVRMAHRARSPHVGSALSAVEVVVALYFRILNAAPGRSGNGDDRFILSKGHGCISYYAALAHRGYFPREELETYARDGSKLPEHPSPGALPGIDVGTGSLGHGLSIAAGMALARVLDRRGGRIFTLLSDGECNEGSVWEAAMFASRRELDNLVVVVDYNKLQAMGRSDEITGLAPLADKWRAFGWADREIDGNDMAAVVQALEALPFSPRRPSVLIAHTVKGKGVSYMEDDLEWHYRPPNDADLARALSELGR